jgi:hypothetical protein
VVKVRRGTEAGDAPAWQGDEEPEYREYSGDEHLAGEAKRSCEAERSEGERQRSQAGCSVRRMQAGFHHRLPAARHGGVNAGARCL